MADVTRTVVATRPMLKRLGKSTKHLGRNILVCTDGSRLSLRATRLAAYLLGDLDTITIFYVTDGPGDDPLQLFRKIEMDLVTTCGVPKARFNCEAVSIKEGFDVKSTIMYRANHIAGGRGLLLIGAAGRRLEDADKSKGRRPGGQAPMGSVSEACMAKVKIPVILVKGKATPALDSDDMMRKRSMLSPEAAAQIICCVDGGHLSQRCFDVATQLARRGDTVTVLSVSDPDHATPHTPRGTGADQALMDERGVKAYYESECSKAMSTNPLITTRFEQQRKAGTIRDSIINRVEELEADIILMGSIELAKPDTPSAHALLRPRATPVPLPSTTTCKPRLSQSTPLHFAVGSVSAQVAKRTEAHPLIIKSFASTSFT